jgi:hypothetical protein
MFKLAEDWKEILLKAYKDAGIITEETKEKNFSVAVGVKRNGINYCEIKQKL